MRRSDMRFAGKKAIVTGSAGAIGGAIAQAFAAEGASLGLIDIKRSHGTAEAVAALGCRAFDHPADLSRTEELKQAIAGAIDSLGGIDILVNAGGVTSFGSAAAL